MRLIALVLALLLLPMAGAQASVRCVQEFMAQTAFDPGPVDGAWGKRTALALEEYFTQVGETVEGGVGQGNVEAVCALLTGAREDELLAKGAFRIYAITVDMSEVEGAEDVRRTFDFSKFDIATDAYFDDCTFTIIRHEDGGTRRMANGEVSIGEGTLFFGTHQWYSGGALADDTYLPEQANLRLTREGMVVGRMPYFHLFRDPGEVDEPPRHISLATSYKALDVFPNGTSSMVFDESGFYQEVDLELYCKPA